ncbi:hypothetical protein [Rhizobium leguminosarum]|uniref:hypothetical protein n=1 Tax=Rhizobium leguminosarum TaxID=384 RepID=UPI0013AFE8F5|nr:hypothetical protein [Rhizobium leguminosarum]
MIFFVMSAAMLSDRRLEFEIFVPPVVSVITGEHLDNRAKSGNDGKDTDNKGLMVEDEGFPVNLSQDWERDASDAERPLPNSHRHPNPSLFHLASFNQTR